VNRNAVIASVIAVAVIGIGIGVAVGAMGSPGASPSPAAQVAESAPAATDGGNPSPSTVTGSPSASASVAPSPSVDVAPSATPLPPGADPLMGTDGRLTVLLLGSDYRPAHPGNRTDAIMVVSVDPVTGKTGAVSIPRDLLNFPLPGGGVWNTKVNALYQHLLSTTKDGDKQMERAVSEALDVEIDGLVRIGFPGVLRMVSAIGGVTVKMDESYYDSHYWVNGHTQGWGLSKGTHKLNAENALIFARSRKGDSDYGRAARQQQLVMAAVDKVKKKGIDDLPKLLSIAKETVRTDLPRSQASRIFEIVSRANLAHAKRAVLGPKRFGVLLGGSAYQLDLKKVHAWIKRNFPPVTPNGTWPVASPAVSGSPAPLGSPAPSPSTSG
jgi:polyisoprenyl-teichoic acid--peptidoglycan teichoic acid transferase